MKEGLQNGLWELAATTEFCQVDNSSAATHQLRRKGKKRDFNERFLSLLNHYNMKAHSINVRAANENGDVESAHSHTRRYLRDRLSLRGSNDFESIEAYQEFINEAIGLRNSSRAEKLAAEKAFMKPLDGSRLPDYEEEVCRCNKYGLVRIGKCSYSIPQKYRHQTLRVRIYETRVSLYYEKNCIASFETHPNESGARIDYRHLIVDLCRKPGAFARYRYQAEFFPGQIWRKSYEQLQQNYSEGRANKEYLQILKLTLEEGKEAVEALLTNLLKENKINLDQVRHQLGKQETSCYSICH